MKTDYKSKLENEELSLIEIVSLGNNVYFSNFREFILPYFILLFPLHLLTVLCLYFITTGDPTLVFAASILYFLLVLFIAPLVATLFMYVSAIIVDKIFYNNSNNPYQMLGARLIPLLLLTIRFTINYLLRSLLLLIPGLIYAIDNYFYDLAFVLRDQRGRSAFRYSQVLTKGNRGKTFWIGFLILIPVSVVGGIFGFIFSFLPINNFFSSLMATVLSALLTNGFLLAKIFLFYYFDLNKNVSLNN